MAVLRAVQPRAQHRRRPVLAASGVSPPSRPSYEPRARPAQAALQAIERHLTDQPFFVADRYTIADIALYAYTHVAPEGGFELEPYPAISAWLPRVMGQPGHVPITA